MKRTEGMSEVFNTLKINRSSEASGQTSTADTKVDRVIIEGDKPSTINEVLNDILSKIGN